MKNSRRDIAAYLVGAGLSGLGGLIATPVILSFYDISILGQWGLVEALVAFAVPLVLVGTHLGLIKQIAYDQNAPLAALRTLGLCVQPMLALGVAGIFLGVLLIGEGTSIALALAALVYGEALLLLASSALRGAEHAWSYASTQVLRPIVFIGLVLLFGPCAETGDQLLWLVVARLASTAAVLALALLSLQRLRRAARTDHVPGLQGWSALRDAVRYGAPIYAVSFSQILIDSADRFFLAETAGSAATGEYIAHVKLVSMVNLGMIAPFSLWWAQERYRCFNLAEAGKVRIARIAGIWLYCLVFGAMSIAALSPLVFPHFAPGATFDPPLLSILLISVLAAGMIYPLNNAAMLPGNTHWNAWAGFAVAGINLLLCGLLVPRFGARGAALAACAANLVLTGSLHTLSQRSFAVPVSGRRLLLVGLVGAGLIVVVAHCSGTHVTP